MENRKKSEPNKTVTHKDFTENNNEFEKMRAGSSKVATTIPSSDVLPAYSTATPPPTGSPPPGKDAAVPDLATTPALMLSTPCPLARDADSFRKANTKLVENYLMENKKILDWLDKTKGE